MNKYIQLYSTMIIQKPEKVQALVDLIKRGEARYKSLKTQVPWYVIGIIHLRECSCSFEKHLHNGDPLEAKTVRVPKGRPAGNPPWTWEESALDALQDIKTTNWSIENILHDFEAYNGMGYANHGINSPYLWGGTQHYIKGLYVADNKFDPDFVWTGIGCAPILKSLIEEPKTEVSEVMKKNVDQMDKLREVFGLE